MADPSITSIELQIEASARKAMPEIDNLISKLDTLSSKLTSVASVSSKTFTSSINGVTGSIKSLETALGNVNFSSLISQLEAISKIDLSNLSKLGTVGGNVASKGASSLGKGLGSAALQSVKNAWGGAVKVVKTAGSGFIAAGRGAAAGIGNIGKASVRAVSGLKNLASSMRKTQTHSKGLVSSFLSLYATLKILRGIFGAFSKSATRAMDFIETFHYFDVSFKKVAADATENWAALGYDSAEAYADSFEQRALSLTSKMSGFNIDQKTGEATATGVPSLGLDPDMVMNYQAQFAQMANGLGMTTEAAMATSEALTMLGADWSALRNISFEESYTKMASALAGQSRAVRSLGVDITQATLAQYAANAGIETSISKMSGAQKAQLRMIAILDQSRVAWGDMAKTLNTPANQFRLISQNVNTLARIIGNIFLPVIQKVLPYINGLVIALQRLFTWLAKLLGVKISDEGGVGGLSDAFADLGEEDASEGLGDVADAADDAGNALETAAENAEELKRTILGFDELNVLNAPTKDTSTGSGNGGSGKTGSTGITSGINPGDTLALDNALTSLLDQYKSVWESALGDLENQAQGIADRIVAAFKNKDWEGLGKTIADLLWKGVKKLGDLFDPSFINPKIDEFTTAVAGIINGFFDPNNNLWHDLGGSLGNILNAAVRTANELWDKVNFENIGKSLGMAFNDLIMRLDTYEMGRLLMQKFNAAIDLATGFLEQNQGNFSSWGQKFEDFLMGALDAIKPAKIARVINLAVSGAIDFIGGIGWTRLGNKIGDKLGELIEKVDTDNIGRLIAKVITSGIDLAKGFLDSMRDKWSTLGTKVGSMLAVALGDIPVDDIKQVVSDVMYGVLDFLKNGINEFRKKGGFSNLATLVGGLLNSVFADPGKWEELGEVVRDGLKGALEFLLKLGDIIDWKGIGTGIHDLIRDVIYDDELWASAFGALKLWCKGLVTFIQNAFPTEEEWRKIGTRIAELLQAVPWASVFGTVIRAIIAAAKGLWDGLGSTFAGRIVQGIIAFKISYGLLSPFFSGIGDIIKGEIVKRLIGGRVKTMLGDALTEGAEGAAAKVATNSGLSHFASAIGSALKGAAPGLGLGAGIFATVKGAEKLQSLSEQARGLNGDLTSIGTTVEDVTNHAANQGGPIKTMTDEQRMALLKLQDQMENTGASNDQMATAVAGLLGKFGYTSDEVRTLWEETASGINASKEQTEFWDSVVSQLPDTVEAANSRIDLSNVNSQNVIGDVQDAWLNCRGELGLMEAQQESLDGAIWNSIGTSASAQEAYDLLRGKCEELGIPIEKLDTLFGTAFPTAVQTGATASSTAMDGARTSISGSMTGIEKQISTSSEAARRSLEQKFGEAKAISVKDFADTATGANREFGNVASAAQTKATEARDKWLAGMRSAKTEGEREVTSIRDTAQTRFSDIARAANDNGIKAKLDFVRNLTSAKTESDRELSTTATNAMRHLGAIASTASTKSSEAEKAISSKFGSASTTVNDKTGAMNTDTYRNMQLQFGQVKFFTDNMESYISNKWKIINRDMSNTTMPNFKEAVGTGMNKALTAISGFVDKMADKVGELSGKFKTAGSDAGGELRRGLNEADYSSLGSDIVSAITSPFNGLNSEMWYAGYNAISNLQNGMNTAGLKVPHVGWTWDTVYYGDGDWVQVPNFNVQWYAKGGLFEVPTIAGFGEAGDEAALPLTNRSVMARVANAIVDAGGIGNSLNRDDMVEAVATGVAMAMAQNPQTVEVIVQSVLKTDDERLAQAVSRGQARLDQRYNATPAYGF